ncbi:hypothetical protein [Methylomicrobium lacus]|uniref:hypothetical protein n=1 Tax=Methylomicrobium lacus TaxID=136992 RepID=UPI0035A8181A
MAINHVDFLDFAKSLPEASEINLRNAMSRAFYAAFHGCGLKYSSAFSNADVGSHEKLIQALQKSPASEDRAIGYMLSQLKGFRVIADYKLTLDVTIADKNTSLLQTEKLMQKINAFSNPSIYKIQINN